MRTIRAFVVLALGLSGALIQGCSSTYLVPGRAADFTALGITGDEQAALTDSGIARELDRKPAASFPARIGVLRIQETGYRSYSARGRDLGSFSVVSVRDIESEEDAGRLASMPMVRDVVALNGFVIEHAYTIDDLRRAAARVHADMLLVYTLDTSFTTESTVPVVGVITLGLFPNDMARVNSTATAALIDTRTGYIYALAEASAEADQLANAWTKEDAVEQSRSRAEGDAYNKLLAELERAWAGVVRGHVRPVLPAANQETSDLSISGP